MEETTKTNALTNAERLRQMYRDRAEWHVCVRCSKQDARTLAGRKMCERCAAERREHVKRHPPKTKQPRAYFRERYRKLREAGKCPICAMPATDGKTYCESCRQKRREALRKKKEAQHEAEK